MTPDLINGAFEALAGLMVLNHCRVLMKDKAVRGVSIASVAFFTAWGVWNLHYYPALDQTASFAGGLVVVAANAPLYVAMLLRYAGAWRALRRRLGAVACRFRGHRFDAPVIRANCLYFCTRCGQEMTGRTFADLDPLSDKELEDLHREWAMEEQP